MKRALRGKIAALAVMLLLGCRSEKGSRIILMPVEGQMMVNAVVPGLDRQVFGLGVPETIGSREHMWLVNHPDVDIRWVTDPGTGAVSTTWRKEGLIEYALSLVPSTEQVAVTITVTNLSASPWRDVFAFNCISPAKTQGLKDPSLSRTYLSVKGQPTQVATLPRVRGPRPTVTVYPTRNTAGRVPPFAVAFEATAPFESDGNWVAVVDEAGKAYMATTTPGAAFLFTNTKFGCIHAAPSFGEVRPGEEATVTSQVFLSRGTLRDFLDRYAASRSDR